MDRSDTVLNRYHKDCRLLYAYATIVLAIFSVVVLFYQETWAGAFMFALVTSLLWSFHWNAGRRIKNGAFAAGVSFWSRMERADLERWLEHKGGTRLHGANLPG